MHAQLLHTIYVSWHSNSFTFLHSLQYSFIESLLLLFDLLPILISLSVPNGSYHPPIECI